MQKPVLGGLREGFREGSQSTSRVDRFRRPFRGSGGRLGCLRLEKGQNGVPATFIANPNYISHQNAKTCTWRPPGGVPGGFREGFPEYFSGRPVPEAV